MKERPTFLCLHNILTCFLENSGPSGLWTHSACNCHHLHQRGNPDCSRRGWVARPTQNLSPEQRFSLPNFVLSEGKCVIIARQRPPLKAEGLCELRAQGPRDQRTNCLSPAASPSTNAAAAASPCGFLTLPEPHGLRQGRLYLLGLIRKPQVSSGHPYISSHSQHNSLASSPSFPGKLLLAMSSAQSALGN